MSRNVILFILVVIFLIPNRQVKSQSLSEIQDKIENHNEKIKQLETEIKAYEKQIETTGAEAKSLQGAIQVLDISQNKITTEIKKTETNITKTNLAIEKLQGDIGKTEEKISRNVAAIARALDGMRQTDEQSIIESLLTNKSLADVFDEYKSIIDFQQEVRKQSAELNIYRDELALQKGETEQEKKKLQSLKANLGDQNIILSNNKKEKTTLLTETKSKEAEYKRQLAQKQAEKERFEKELFDFESQLKRSIDPNSYPSAKKGILAYPLDNIFVTQAFGRTVEAKRLYVSGTHNGVDFRASRGTPVKSVLDGTIKATGNTDEQRGCYSYGRWILVEHPNGLTSLYAHLDLTKVSMGQKVSEGEIIGYSGQTGYATGPHLHFTLYASQGVIVQKYSSSLNCKNVSIPVADKDAYLDPMLYF